MMDQLSVSQFKALLYADIFEYPLTKQELGKFQISKLSDVSIGVRPQASDKSQINSKFQITNNFRQKNDYFYLSGRQNLIVLRKQKEKYSEKKIIIAQKAANLLRVIPTIKMLAVSGAVAVGNADKDDDIDFLIITKPGTIWTTRFFSIILLEFLGKRRRPNDKNFKNKICLNMFVDENHLQVPKNEQDLFSAHEAAQVKILWSRGDAEERWWGENEWIRKYLPEFRIQNSEFRIKNPKSEIRNTKQIRINKFSNFQNHFLIRILKIVSNIRISIFEFIEFYARKIQLSYMQSKRTKEVVKDGYLRFHPYDARKWIFEEYQKRLRKYGLG